MNSIPDKIPNINKETSNTLMLVTDPYHDYNLSATGYPDGSAIMSAIQRRYSRNTIANPFTLTTGQTWAFHIYSTPLHFKHELSTGTLQGNTLVFGSGTVFQGPLNVQFFKYDVGGALIDSITIALGSDSPYNNGNTSQVRTVSFGYELHNTTAEINRSGSLTIYRAPPNYHDVNLFSKNAAVVRPFGAKHINQLPNSIETATNYPNTRTWEAAKGVYSVCLPSPQNPFSMSIPSNFMLQTGTIPSNYAFQFYDSYETTRIVPTHSPLSCTGVFSSKYSTDQTFTLDFRQILEILPTSNDPTDLSFASTCKPCDRLFMKMYKQMYTEIPPGVPVSMNAAGDWCRNIVKIAKTVLPAIGQVPGVIGNVAKVASPIVSLIDSKINKKLDTSNRTLTVKQIKSSILQNPKLRKLVKAKNKTKSNLRTRKVIKK